MAVNPQARNPSEILGPGQTRQAEARARLGPNRSVALPKLPLPWEEAWMAKWEQAPLGISIPSKMRESRRSCWQAPEPQEV